MNKILSKKAIAFVMAFILTFSVVTFIGNDEMEVSAASTTSISIKKSPTLKAGTIKATSVKLSWTTTKNVSSYKLYKSTDKKTWKSVATTKATSYTVSKLTAGTKYYFRLIAISGKTKSPYSNTVSVTPKPERVGSLKIKFSSNTQASVSWSKISGATGYEIFLSTSSDFKKDLKKYTVKGGDKTSYTIKNMKNGTKYYVKVRAVRQVGKKNVVGTCSYKCQLITKSKTYYNYVSQKVYATADVSIRKGAGISYSKLGSLKKGKSITRTAIGNNGWSKVSYKDTTAYIASKYLSTEKPKAEPVKTYEKFEQKIGVYETKNLPSVSTYYEQECPAWIGVYTIGKNQDVENEIKKQFKKAFGYDAQEKVKCSLIGEYLVDGYNGPQSIYQYTITDLTYDLVLDDFYVINRKICDDGSPWVGFCVPSSIDDLYYDEQFGKLTGRLKSEMSKFSGYSVDYIRNSGKFSTPYNLIESGPYRTKDGQIIQCLTYICLRGYEIPLAKDAICDQCGKLIPANTYHTYEICSQGR
ncbi:MAG: fibronectin type III domain-containing protein [Acutalibacteraceae bacterium]